MAAILAAALGAAVLASVQYGGRVEAAPTYSLWPSSATPKTLDDPDRDRVELGTRFRSSRPGQILALRFYKLAGNRGPHTASLWDSSGRRLGRVTFTAETSSGWQQAALATPISVAAGTDYVVSYTSDGPYAGDQNHYANGQTIVSGPLTASAGVYDYGLGFPTKSWRASNYYVDVVFTPSTSTSTSSSTTTPSTTTTTSTQTTTAPPQGCAQKPSVCGYPDASNTGVPAGVTLKRVPQDVSSGPGWTYDSRGWIRVYGSGATFSGYIVNVNVDVTAPNVTIKENQILVGNQSWGISLRHASGATIADNDIGGAAGAVCDNAIRDIYGDSDAVTIRRNDIRACASGINHFNLGGTIADNYIHDIGHGCTVGDSSCGHFNGIQLGAGLGGLMRITRNTILIPAPMTDAIMLANDDGPQRNREITGNLLAGGGYTFYGSGSSAGVATNITFTDNRFSTIYYPRSGYWGPVTHWQRVATNTWERNTWIDGPNAGGTVLP